MDNLRRFLVVFISAVFITLSISGFVLADKYNESYAIKTQSVDVDASVFDPENMDVALLEPLKDNILLIVGDKSNSDTELVIIANVNTETSELSFMFIPEDFKYKSYDRAGELLKDLGVAEAADSLASYFNTTIDYYLHLSSESFVNLINTLDFNNSGIKFEIPCDLNYKSGSYNIDLKKGIQNLNGEQALQLIQFYRTKNNIYPANMIEYYDGTRVKRIESAQKFTEQFIKQKLINNPNKDFVNMFAKGALSVLDVCVTNLEEIHLKKLGFLFSNLSAKSINYFMPDGDNTLIGSGSLVYNNRVTNLSTGDIRDGAAVLEEFFVTG